MDERTVEAMRAVVGKEVSEQMDNGVRPTGAARAAADEELGEAKPKAKKKVTRDAMTLDFEKDIHSEEHVITADLCFSNQDACFKDNKPQEILASLETRMKEVSRSYPLVELSSSMYITCVRCVHIFHFLSLYPYRHATSCTRKVWLLTGLGLLHLCNRVGPCVQHPMARSFLT